MKKNLIKRMILTLILLVCLSFIIASTSSAQSNLEMAEQYAPIFYFEAEENCFPIDANYHIDNSDLYQIQINDAIKIDSWSSSNLDDYSDESYFLDNIHGTVNDDGVIAHYNANKANYDITVYYRANTDLATGFDYVQYWMFYAFNDGELNRHEGDWEMVQVVIPNNGEKYATYSMHYSSHKASWDLIDKDGDHIKVYVARGSHANYFKPFAGKLGFANDIVADNGRILSYTDNDYVLKNIEDYNWKDFGGRWGEVGENLTDAVSSSVLGNAGPESPTARANGDMWNNPIAWANSGLEESEMFFQAKWFIYNFVMIYVLISIIIFAIICFFIYRRHKKTGLGPRFVSMLYIDGFNLKSIGNIVFIVGIIIVIVGLFNNWYSVSYDFSSQGLYSEYDTSGLADLLSIDGINGLQIVIPGQNGATPIGTLSIPFSLIIALGIIFTIIATIGLYRSKKLGYKYIWRGIRIIIPILLLIIVIIAIASFIPVDMMQGSEYIDFNEVINSISSSPFGGEKQLSLNFGQGLYLPITIKWGLGLGAYLILFGGIILIVAGILQVAAKEEFFEPKTSFKLGKNKKEEKPDTSKPAPAEKNQTSSIEEIKSSKICPNCGKEINKDASFCTSCGIQISEK
jgi:hypothetical protein